MVTPHIWQEYVEEADHLRHHKDVKPIYAKRKETDAKEKHGMRWTILRGLKKLTMQAMLTFAAHKFKENGLLDLERSSDSLIRLGEADSCNI